MTVTTSGAGRRGASWHMLSTIVLRQAGYPMDLLAGFAAPEVAEAAGTVFDGLAELKDARGAALEALRALDAPAARAVATRIGQGRQPRPAELRRLGDAPAVRRYLTLVDEYTSRVERFRQVHAEATGEGRRAVVELFTAPRLRDVLLLSNDAVHDAYIAWLDAPGDLGTPSARRKLDTLTMYLQRVATKNETHSHFGPFTVGEVRRDRRGLDYSIEGTARPVAFLTNWAAGQLARALSDVPELRETITPRRRPLAFVGERRVDLYAFTSETGYAADWRFVRTGDWPLDEAGEWLLRACDGATTLGELRAGWSARGFGGADACDARLREFEAIDVVTARFEVPPGDAYPLDTLVEQFQPALAAHPDVRVLGELGGLLDEFAAAPFAARPALLAAARDTFVRQTGQRPHRGEGRLYADRSIMYEERRSGLQDLRLGGDLARFVEQDMAVVYDLALAGPRLRMRRESAILTDWFAARYGPDRPVRLDAFYEGFFDDRASLALRCAAVEEELAELDAKITDALLSGADPGVAEVEIPRERLLAVLDAYPDEPAAVCNPDVMIAARSLAAIADGDFLAVVGDCHAVRELISHTSFSPLVQQERPGTAAEVLAAYEALLDDDEVLVDVVRGHPDKTAVQLQYGCPDLELFGRSRKPRGRVIQPADVLVELRGDRLELRARGVQGRLRLMAPPAGGPSIIKDPLSVYSFPRHFGGIPLHGAHLDHLPRLRCGRVVVQRELWRIPMQRFGGHSGRTEADDFLAAQALRREYGLPRRVFAKFGGEPKPVFVDWDAPLLVRQCVRMARVSTGPVEFSEMLPDTDQLWLDVAGERYTSELRCAVFSRGKG